MNRIFRSCQWGLLLVFLLIHVLAWGQRTTAIKVMMEVSKGDEELERIICYENAFRLLRLGD